MIKIGIMEMQEFEKIIANEKPSIVDFSAVWCGPCKMMEPVLEDAADRHDEMNFYQVDVDSASEIAARYQISAVPTIVAFKNGRETARISGYMNIETFESFLKQV